LERVVDWVVGPRGRVIVSAHGVDAENVKRFRPVDVLVDESIVLRRTFQFATASERDLISAAALEFEAATPFVANELVFGANMSEARQGSDVRRVDVAAVPRELLRQALESVNLDILQARSVSTRSPACISLKTGKRFWPVLVLVSSLAILLLALSFAGSQVRQLEDARSALLDLRTQIDGARARTKELLDEVDRRSRIQEMLAEESQAAGAVPSVTAALVALGTALPNGVEVLRIDLRSDGMRVGLRAPNVMNATAEIKARLADWVVELDAGITVDPASKVETSIALVRAAR
jgi:Tfp pilus assembly protein PilN